MHTHTHIPHTHTHTSDPRDMGTYQLSIGKDTGIVAFKGIIKNIKSESFKNILLTCKGGMSCIMVGIS